MNDLEDTLPGALDELGRRAAHRTDLAERARRGVRRRRITVFGPAVVVLAVLVILGSIWVGRPGSSPPAAQPPSACSPLLTTAPPVWARDGFSGRSYPPFAYSASGNLVAIVFGDPLTAPPAADHNNKILWVSRQSSYGAGNLVITGHLEGTDRTVRIDTGTSPGPSIVDMPAAGCWHLELSWAGNSDSIDLRWSDG